MGYRPRDSWTEFEPEKKVVEGGKPSPDNWPEGS